MSHVKNKRDEFENLSFIIWSYFKGNNYGGLKAKKRHDSFGKTEMCYIMQADEDARIIVGFKENSNATEYLENL